MHNILGPFMKFYRFKILHQKKVLCIREIENVEIVSDIQ